MHLYWWRGVRYCDVMGGTARSQQVYAIRGVGEGGSGAVGVETHLQQSKVRRRGPC